MAKDQVLFIGGMSDERPADIPENWTIYNASRPLPGHKTWTGNFRHGIFYAAVAPDGDQANELDNADYLHERNRQLDGHVCVWVSRERVVKYAEERCKEYGVDLADFDFSDFVDSFVGAFRRGDV